MKPAKTVFLTTLALLAASVIAATAAQASNFYVEAEEATITGSYPAERTAVGGRNNYVQIQNGRDRPVPGSELQWIDACVDSRIGDTRRHAG